MRGTGVEPACLAALPPQGSASAISPPAHTPIYSAGVSFISATGASTACSSAGLSAIAAAKSGQVQAAILVGGQPLGNVKTLGTDFKLLGFRQQTVDLLKTVYVADKLSYPKLANGAVSTIATEALLVTRTVNTPERIAALSNLRGCVIKNVPEWQDADGAHPAWAQVDVANHGKWAYYDLPTTKVGKK